MVLLKKVVNANPGTADLVGGNDWDKLADYFNDTNVSETPRINNPTEYRSGILNIRDGSNAFNVILKSATQTANRDITIPALIGNDSFATLAIPNVFTAIQQVQLDADTLLSLYRPVSTANSFCGISFNARNSSNALTNYASISSKLIVNTAGTEDGKLIFYVRKAGVLTEVMSIDKNGLLTVTSVSTGGGTAYAATDVANTFTQNQIISENTTDLLKLYRPANTINNLVGMSFDHRNASNAAVTYGKIETKLIGNTAGDEDGMLVLSVIKDGVMTQVGSLDKNGLLTVNSISTGGAAGTYVTTLLNTGTTVNTASTSSEFDLLNYSVPANTLGLHGVLRVRVSGYFLQNNATLPDFTLKIKFGTTPVTLYNGAFLACPQSSSNFPFILDFEIGNKGATNSQGLAGHYIVNDTGTSGLTTGEGATSSDEVRVNSNFRAATGTSTKDTTVNQTLIVTMQMSVSSASVVTNVQRRIIEFLPGA